MRNAAVTVRPARARAPSVTGGVGSGSRRRVVRAGPGARVGCPVARAEAPGAHVRVDLRRREAGVAEQLLDDAQVRAALEQVRGERVAERVRGRPVGQVRRGR